jgi:multidrug efflux pump subunit AcrB
LRRHKHQNEFTVIPQEFKKEQELPILAFIKGDWLIPILARGRIGDRSEVGKNRGLYAPTPDGKAVPFESFSKLKIQPEFVTIPHYNRLRTVSALLT